MGLTRELLPVSIPLSSVSVLALSRSQPWPISWLRLGGGWVMFSRGYGTSWRLSGRLWVTYSQALGTQSPTRSRLGISTPSSTLLTRVCSQPWFWAFGSSLPTDLYSEAETRPEDLLSLSR